MGTVRSFTPGLKLTGPSISHSNSELTFIILARTLGGKLATSEIQALPMVGDVNIFLKGTPGDQEFEAEAEIMIAGELTVRNIYVPLLPTDDHAISFFNQSQTIAARESQASLCNLYFLTPPPPIPSHRCQSRRNLWSSGSETRIQQASLYSRSSGLRSPSTSQSSKRQSCGIPEREFCLSG